MSHRNTQMQTKVPRTFLSRLNFRRLRTSNLKKFAISYLQDPPCNHHAHERPETTRSRGMSGSGPWLMPMPRVAESHRLLLRRSIDEPTPPSTRARRAFSRACGSDGAATAAATATRIDFPVRLCSLLCWLLAKATENERAGGGASEAWESAIDRRWNGENHADALADAWVFVGL